jgi:hypothetical protein
MQKKADTFQKYNNDIVDKRIKHHYWKSCDI